MLTEGKVALCSKPSASVCKVACCLAMIATLSSAIICHSSKQLQSCTSICQNPLCAGTVEHSEAGGARYHAGRQGSRSDSSGTAVPWRFLGWPRSPFCLHKCLLTSAPRGTVCRGLIVLIPRLQGQPVGFWGAFLRKPLEYIEPEVQQSCKRDMPRLRIWFCRISVYMC